MKRKKRPGPGTVYFVVAGPFVKIGWTNRGFACRRVEDMQTGCPYRMRVAFDFQGSQADERALHWYFGEYHERGEWHRLEGRLKAYIEMIDAKPVMYSDEDGDALMKEANKIWDVVVSRRTAREHFKTIINTRDFPDNFAPFTWGAA